MIRKIKEVLSEVEKFISSPDSSEHLEASDEPDLDDGAALVGARLRPRPYLGSGAIALQEPEDHYQSD
jgi:hypothetical protein